MKTIDILSRHDACLDAQRWSGAYPDPVDAWAACTRPEWMLWLIARSQDNRTGLIELACDFAASAAQQLAIGQTRTMCESTIATVRAYLRRESTISTVREARSAALALIEYAAHAADAKYAADAAAKYAADAAYAAAAAAADAAYAAAAAALVDAAYAAYAAADASDAAYAAADAAYADAHAAAHAADASFAALDAARARQCSHIRERFTAKQLIAQFAQLGV